MPKQLLFKVVCFVYLSAATIIRLSAPATLLRLLAESAATPTPQAFEAKPFSLVSDT
ncbi:MAG: hypothetical protein ACYCZF_16785 [Anaerolineae bacterium]